jgi:hypothetical protein
MLIKELIEKLRKFGSDSVVTLSNLKVTDCSGEHWIDVREPVECFICGSSAPYSFPVCDKHVWQLND